VVRDRSKGNAYFKERVQHTDTAKVPGWLSSEVANFAGSVVAEPTREDIDFTLNEQLIVEYYSR